MQLGLPLVESVTHAVASVAHSPVDAGAVPRYFVRHRRARRYVLRVDPDGRLRVTIPRGGSRREAEAFADRNQAWVSTQLARLRTTRLNGEREATADRALRQRAAEELPPHLRAWAARLGLDVAAVSVRDQRTRWGSCGRNRRICLNWRLVLMPDWVRDYVLIHELMHLKRMDHSPRFWSLVEAACPRYREARAWLRAHGPELR